MNRELMNNPGYQDMENTMKTLYGFVLCVVVALALVATAADDPPGKWKVHDMDRPQPQVITPGTAGSPPSDAVVLFDGKDASEWVGRGGQPAKWKVENGAMEANGTGSIRTRKNFGSCQLHVEWATPSTVKGKGQGRGNSGVFLMNQYEVQILDCHQNQTYPDGQAASIYGQNPPAVNACRGPGEWQSYDIIFHRPRFDEAGKVTRPATLTVLHNGVLVQDHFTIWGPTAHKAVATYKAHLYALPIQLQDHGNPVRYRNIWLRPLTD